jgi:hypothetical protein
MNFRTFVFASVLLAPLTALAQSPFPISLGIKGGSALTEAFSDRSSTVNVANPYSPPRDYIVGPTLELRLPLGVSVEADALYRPLHVSSIYGGQYPAGEPETLNSWEFPILAKYHFGFPFVKPFIEAGPSFRRVSELPNDSPHLSAKGVSAGIGVELKALIIRVAPELRYTHWGPASKTALSGFSFNTSSNSNQVEFLLGISF